MNIDEQLKQLSQQTCPKQVDVEARVMEQVRKHPYLQPVVKAEPPATRRWVPWVSLTAAAAAVGLVVVNISPAVQADFNEAQIGSMMAYVSDYDYYAPVESAAENPIECLYGDYDDYDY